MKTFIAKKNTTVSCIYGKFTMVEGNPVPDYIANLFPQYIIEIQNDDIKESTKKGKK